MIIDHIYLPVSDLKRSSEFYEKMLKPLGIDMPYKVGQPPIFGFAINNEPGFWLKNGEVAKDLQGGDRRGSYFNQGTEPSARMACRLLRGKHR
jgi:catechol 2,3-dioxygenase-like lactoylglutathione lyase family enzyme